MNEKNWREQVFYFYMIQIILGHVLVVLAMLLYKGGTRINPYVSGYSFWTNTLSDAGRTKAYSGDPNTVSCILYFIFLFTNGVATILIFSAIMYFFSENTLERKYSKIGSIFGIISGFSLIGIAFFPNDVDLNLHLLFVYLANLSIAIGIIFYLKPIFHNKSFPNIIGYIMIIELGLGISRMIIMMIIQPDYYTLNGLMLVVAGQKFLFYVNSVLNFYMGYILWKQIKS